MEFVSKTSIVGVGSVDGSVVSDGCGHVGRGLNVVVVVVAVVDVTVTSGVAGVTGNFTVGGSFGIVGTFAGVSGVGTVGGGVIGNFAAVGFGVFAVTSHVGFGSSKMMSSTSSSNSIIVDPGVGVGDGILTAGMVGPSGSLSSS